MFRYKFLTNINIAEIVYEIIDKRYAEWRIQFSMSENDVTHLQQTGAIDDL